VAKKKKSEKTKPEPVAERQARILRACGWDPDAGAPGSSTREAARLAREAREAGPRDQIGKLRLALALDPSAEIAAALGEALAADALARARSVGHEHDKALAKAREALGSGDSERAERAIARALAACPASIEAAEIRGAGTKRADAWKTFCIRVARVCAASVKQSKAQPPAHPGRIVGAMFARCGPLEDLRAAWLTCPTRPSIDFEVLREGARRKRTDAGIIAWSMPIADCVAAAEAAVLEEPA